MHPVSIFVVASFLGRVADELREGGYLAAVSYSAAVSPIEYGLYPVVLCLGFEGYVYRAGCFPVANIVRKARSLLLASARKAILKRLVPFIDL